MGLFSGYGGWLTWLVLGGNYLIMQKKDLASILSKNIVGTRLSLFWPGTEGAEEAIENRCQAFVSGQERSGKSIVGPSTEWLFSDSLPYHEAENRDGVETQ